ncbi:MAG TPA: LmbU family transcriptional regulator [Actinophytocola sp.]|uniref:LmbU family transcriptional regulator n=1 Tax=Actinophytocola sp. TaxID=1872138 RepID=UPI002DB8416D|nr:LmbU family transcriptional regulator [Actinophytocola sp.]HEU5471983.1 LmbU family transcriptional regulator [Actinophytocola sp.]
MAETYELARTAVALPDVRPRMEGPAQLRQVRMNGVGLQIPRDLSFEDWAKAGRQLSGIVDSSAWWLGDWLVFGKTHYADCYQLAIQGAGLRYQTLRNYAWVARRFDLGRRRSALTFQHHAEVASLPIEEQERLLDQAEREMWSTKQLRSAVREERVGEAEEEETAALVPISSRIAVPSHRVGVWRRAADCLGVAFDQWVLTILDRAAIEALDSEFVEGAEVLV